jgi:hypothetical protein
MSQMLVHFHRRPDDGISLRISVHF